MTGGRFPAPEYTVDNVDFLFVFGGTDSDFSPMTGYTDWMSVFVLAVSHLPFNMETHVQRQVSVGGIWFA